ncbi:MAG: hypothetical protein KDA37_16510, partial [Planctomycetales bacterium]|nr:hypothetical protein [Planctomycetales bacterium]
SAYQELVKRNLFARGFAKALNEIELKAITFDRQGTAQAWFRVDSRGTTQTISVGQNVPVPLHDIAVMQILPNKVLVHVNQEPYWLSLGQSIGQVAAVTYSAEASPSDDPAAVSGAEESTVSEATALENTAATAASAES